MKNRLLSEVSSLAVERVEAEPHRHRTALKQKEVEKTTSLSKSQIHRLVLKGDFPKPRRLSAGRIGWFSDDIQSWLDQCAVHAIDEV